MTAGRSQRDRSSRDRLLQAAVGVPARGATSQLGLRQLAAEIGTSHRMLIYHFGSKDGLIAAVVGVVEAQQRAALDRLLADDGLARRSRQPVFGTQWSRRAGDGRRQPRYRGWGVPVIRSDVSPSPV